MKEIEGALHALHAEARLQSDHQVAPVTAPRGGATAFATVGTVDAGGPAAIAVRTVSVGHCDSVAAHCDGLVCVTGAPGGR